MEPIVLGWNPEAIPLGCGPILALSLLAVSVEGAVFATMKPMPQRQGWVPHQEYTAASSCSHTHAQDHRCGDFRAVREVRALSARGKGQSYEGGALNPTNLNR